LQSLNEVIDVDEARWTAFQNQVPATIIYVIIVVGLLALLMVGYTFGLGGRRQLFSICVLSLAISLVLAVIIDLDRPQGRIRVSQQPMLDLQKQLHSR
jgi:prepilin signal peptidase PulO-like enzyme (type II secretory pathway)